MGILGEVRQKGPNPDVEGKEGLCSPPPWRVWASGELRRLRRLWSRKTGAVHGTDPNSPVVPDHRHPGPPPARCAVPLCKLSCPPIAQSKVYFPVTQSLCGTWTHQPPAAVPATAAVLLRWVHGAAWWRVQTRDLSAGQTASAIAL